MVKMLIPWRREFTFHGKTLPYNRHPYNNRAERVVEVALAREFLARQPANANLLEIGNVLKHYEADVTAPDGAIPARRIVDKFEVGQGIENLDIFDLDPAQLYQAIVCISTVEHVGQNCAPTGEFGEVQVASDLEAPLKAIAKIYALLAPGGRALITVPFGRLIDGGWYIQFSSEYLELLTRAYGVPSEALVAGYLRRVASEKLRIHPRQIWVECAADELSEIRYDNFWSGARAIVAIELTKLEQPFTLLTDVPMTSLTYERSQLTKNLFFKIGSLLRHLQ